jgi:hypothetical protein
MAFCQAVERQHPPHQTFEAKRNHGKSVQLCEAIAFFQSRPIGARLSLGLVELLRHGRQFGKRLA